MRPHLYVFIVVLFGVVLYGVPGCGGAQSGSLANPMPEGGNFDGVYQSDFGRLEITVNGDFAYGLYEGDRQFGRLEGKLSGTVLRFEWKQWDERLGGKLRESSGRGVFNYILEFKAVGDKQKAVHRLEGEWGYGEEQAGNRWNAFKLSDRTKKRLTRRGPDQVQPNTGDEQDAGTGFVDVDHR